ncbi:FAD-binding protein [Candidatus Bathyarchaeota archaeon]|nr:FAD-binding protein [Candidatus Bathyarchaeota archaeon]
MEYVKVTEETITELNMMVGPTSIVTKKEDMEKYSHDESPTKYAAFPEVVVKPQNTEQVSRILTLANKKGIPVTLRGQGTGLSSAAVPNLGGVLISFENMNRILEIDEDNLVAVVEPGVILLHLRQELEKRGLFYPADPGEPSSAIGGNISTNAGGMNGVKYGNTRGHVLGLEIVLPSGEILNLGGKTFKRSSGYELMHLIVGSEGTLAAVTKITLKLIKLPKFFITLYIPFENLHDAIRSVPEIIRRKVTPPAIEFVEKDYLLMVEEHLNKTMPQHDAQAYLILRIDGDSNDELYKIGEDVTNICLENNARDVLVADTRETQERIWSIRSGFYEAAVHKGVQKVVDTVVPPSKIAEYIEKVKNISHAYSIRILSVGHAGDGNIHLILMRGDLIDGAWNERCEKAMTELYQTALGLGGTISGEHGIGIDKKEYLAMGIDRKELEIMKGIKRVFDQNNIMNPGKIFDMD